MKPFCVHTGVLFWLQAAGSQKSAVPDSANDLQVCEHSALIALQSEVALCF